MKRKWGAMIHNYVYSVGMQGLKGQIIRVEATVWDDKEQCIIIGLPDASIKESKERILNCLLSLGIDTNMKKITILLSPSDVKKQGTSYAIGGVTSNVQRPLTNS